MIHQHFLANAQKAREYPLKSLYEIHVPGPSRFLHCFFYF
jgi:hypothetical protein